MIRRTPPQTTWWTCHFCPTKVPVLVRFKRARWWRLARLTVIDTVEIEAHLLKHQMEVDA